MVKIQILGAGCAKCEKLTRNAEAAATALGIEYELEHVTDVKEMMKFGVMVTPALVVDGVVKAVGNVPEAEELKGLLA